MQHEPERRYVEAVRASDGRLLSEGSFVLGPLSRLDAIASGAALFLGVVGAVRAREALAADVSLAPLLAVALLLWGAFAVVQWQVAGRRWRDEGVPEDWFRATPAGIATLLQLWVLTLTSLTLAVYALGG